MDKNQENLDSPRTEPDSVLAADKSAMATRRKFAQGAASAAVLLSLGNRAAWGQQDTLCISEQVWTSYTTAGNLSFDPTKHDDDVTAFENYEGIEVPGPDVGADADQVCKIPPT